MLVTILGLNDIYHPRLRRGLSPFDGHIGRAPNLLSCWKTEACLFSLSHDRSDEAVEAVQQSLLRHQYHGMRSTPSIAQGSYKRGHCHQGCPIDGEGLVKVVG
jgi:uncharacterized protein YoaH (UPF0181 family)